MNYDEDYVLSKSIDFLRFPLAFLVVLLHSFALVSIGLRKIADISTPIYDLCNFFIGSNVCRLAVPAFFVMSGFLLFYNAAEYDVSTYKKKLKSRVKTLLVPYLFWNASVILLHLIISIVSPSSLSGAAKPIMEYTLGDYIACFWSMGFVNGFDVSGNSPINTPLWFIRDLMLFVIVSPIVYFIINKMKIVIVIFLAVAFCFDFLPLHSYETSMLVFCSLGAFMGIRKKSLLKLGNKYSLFIFVGLSVLNYFVQNDCISRILILFGISAIWYIVPVLVKKGLKFPSSLTAGAFVIYAVHMELLRVLSRVFFKWSAPTNDLVVVFVFVQVFVCIGIAFFLKEICLRFIPKFSRSVMGAK